MGKTQETFEKKLHELSQADTALVDAKKELDSYLYKYDKHGNVVRGKKGKAILAWFKIIRNIGRIVALIEHIVKPSKQN